MIIIAHDIRSLHNVGAIFRNCAAFGVEKLYLTGYTAQPPRKEIAKVSLGAEELIEWEQGDIADVIIKLKKQEFIILGLETGENVISISDFATSDVAKSDVALVLGNEVDGIDSETINMLDQLVEIPMDKKRSLNVSVASGVAMHALQKSNTLKKDN